MKNKIVILLILSLLFGALFTVPAQANVSNSVLFPYLRNQSGSVWTDSWVIVYPGSYEYWRVRTIEEKSWVGANRPEKLMGDANIDGKVDARDALVALYYGLYGNVLTAEILTPAKTPEIVRWTSSFQGQYNSNQLDGLVDNAAFCWQYCRYNSAFFADVTKDCVVNSLDAMEILKYSVGKAENFPEGDFTTLHSRFYYYPWPTEYYPGFFEDYQVDMTDEEFCEKYNYYPDATPTDQ